MHLWSFSRKRNINTLVTVTVTDDILSLKGAWSLSRELFNFWKISDNISKTVRDSLMVSIKFE